MPGKSRLFKVYRGDTTFYFAKDKEYKAPYLEQVFKKRIQNCDQCSWPFEIFPGLVLEDGNGNLLRPELHVQLVPYIPEE